MAHPFLTVRRVMKREKNIFILMVLLFCILFLAVLGSAVCFAMWNTVISRLGVVRANNYIYLQPFITIVASHFLLGEPISWTAIVGALLIVGGVIISGRRAGEKP